MGLINKLKSILGGNHKKASLISLFISEITLRRHKTSNHPCTDTVCFTINNNYFIQ